MKPAFPDIKKITYEGPKSKKPLAFKHYNAEEVMRERRWLITFVSASPTGIPSGTFSAIVRSGDRHPPLG